MGVSNLHTQRARKRCSGVQSKLQVAFSLFLFPLQVLDSELPVMEPYFVRTPDLSESGPGLRVTWLGHATVLVEIDGLNVLTDPIFSQRASPVQFMGPKRYRGPPCSVEQVQYLFLSECWPQFGIVRGLSSRPLSVHSCPGSTRWSSATLITTTWMLDLFPV